MPLEFFKRKKKKQSRSETIQIRFLAWVFEPENPHLEVIFQIEKDTLQFEVAKPSLGHALSEQ